MKIVQVDKIYLFPQHIKSLEKYGQVTIYHDVPNQKEGINRIQDADIVIDNWFEMPANVIQGAKKLKMISIAATGYEWIDLEETQKRNIVVCNSPGYATEAVAEHTIGLILSAARLCSTAEKDLRSGNFHPFNFKGKELNDKTLGIIGYGSIGQRVAQIAQAGLKMKILSINSRSSRSELENLLKKSDVISVNAPITDQTRNLLDDKEFALIKQGVIIVNTGRGAIINENVLIKYLQNGKIFAAGLDVMAKEPIDNTHPLFKIPNVVITPHIAFNTEESEYNLSSIVTQNIINFLDGKPQNVVNN